jgi:molybdopterin converting factor small subunit
MTTIELALFAKFSARHPIAGAGRSARAYPVTDGTTVGGLVDGIGLADEQRITFVNGRHAGDDLVLSEGDRVAIFPPIAGG